MSEQSYEVGDVIEGFFSCSIRPERLRVLVRGRVPAGKGQPRPRFFGDVLDYQEGHGYGAWGYDEEIESIRVGTREDEEIAAAVRQHVSRDTDALIQTWRR